MNHEVMALAEERADRQESREQAKKQAARIVADARAPSAVQATGALKGARVNADE